MSLDSISSARRLTDEAFAAERKTLLAGGPQARPSEALWIESQRVGLALLRHGAGFPPTLYASGGVWDTASTEDAVSSWTTDRLLARGQLRKVVIKSANTAALRRLLEGSLRQHLIDQQDRSQIKNLFPRIKQTLEDDSRFECTHTATKPSEHRYRLAGTTHVFAGDERRLCGMAWAAGDFPALVHRDDAVNLSPVLKGPDLGDFLAGLLGKAGEMAVADALTAMSGRYGLEAPTFDTEADPADARARPEDQLIRAELADGVLAQLTPRQLRVLVGQHEETPGRELAAQLHCSTGTISSELEAIRKALDPLGSHRGPVLNEVLNRVFRARV